MLELLIRVLCDIQPESETDGVFLFGQTHDNQESVLLKAQQLTAASLAKQIMIIDTLPFSGHPGYVAWKNELIKAGVADTCIIGVPLAETKIIHTLVEAEALMRFAKQHNYHSLYITASPFHQLRAFMTAVTAALRIFPQIRLYSQTGTSLSWLEEVVHSQGKTKGTRNQLIAGEIERIEKYQNKGDLASIEQVLAYLNNRDRIS
jgi:uncharacterized SAM-binding protein YcdF (DUF218 family)